MKTKFNKKETNYLLSLNFSICNSDSLKSTRTTPLDKVWCDLAVLLIPIHTSFHISKVCLKTAIDPILVYWQDRCGQNQECFLRSLAKCQRKVCWTANNVEFWRSWFLITIVDWYSVFLSTISTGIKTLYIEICFRLLISRNLPLFRD